MEVSVSTTTVMYQEHCLTTSVFNITIRSLLHGDDAIKRVITLLYVECCYVDGSISCIDIVSLRMAL
jgi:hypothetical protein